MSQLFFNLYKHDQKNLRQWINNWNNRQFSKQNRKLRRKITYLLSQRKVREPVDYFYAAIIYQHGFTEYASHKALLYSRKAVKEGYTKGKWLVAAATDRLLQLQGKLQKFGTQVVNMKAKKLKMYPVNLKTTDKERKFYGLPSLKKLQKRLA